MSRSINPDGSIRYAPDRGHRGPRRSRKAIGAALLVAVPLGGASAIRLGPDVGLPLVGGLALVGLLVVVGWRLTLPHLVSVTVTPTGITLRDYGRTSTVRIDESTRTASRSLQLSLSQVVDYVVIAGEGGQLSLNAGRWSEADLRGILDGIPHHESESELVDPQEFDRQFPGLLPFGVVHPRLAAFVIIVVIVVLSVVAAVVLDQQGMLA